MRQRAIYDAVIAYWTLASALEARRYLDITMHELSLFQDVALEDQKKGMPNAPEKDVMQISIEIDKMAAWRGTLEKWAKTARQALAIAIGRPDANIRIADESVRYRPVKIRYETCLQTAYKYRSDLRAVEDRIQEARLQLSVARKANWPTLSMVASGYLEQDYFGPSKNANGMVGISLNGILFDGFKSTESVPQRFAKIT